MGLRNLRGRHVVLILIATSLLFAIILHLDKPITDGWIKNNVGPDSYKSLLQFFLITLAGGLAFHYANLLKEETARSDAKAKEEAARDDAKAKEAERRRLEEMDAKRDFLQDLDKLYRSGKSAKRILRANADVLPQGNFRIEKGIFEKYMIDINDTQLKLEQLREIVHARTDIFDKTTRDRLTSAIHYSARYFHDLFEDYEKHNVEKQDNLYIVGDKCKVLPDFFKRSGVPADIESKLSKMQDGVSIDARWDAFKEIEAQKTDRRFRPVAEECFSLCAASIRSELATTH